MPWRSWITGRLARRAARTQGGEKASGKAGDVVRPWATQFSRSRSRDVVDLVVGLDFGTSCAKAVIRSPLANAGRATAVSFGASGHRSCRFLLPTRLCILKTGETALRSATPAEQLTDLKVRLMDEPDNPRVVAGATGYLSHVLRLARSWFIQTQGRAYGRYRLRWAVNLGIPSAGYDDEQIRSAFGLAGRAAWRLSVRRGPIRWSQAMELVGKSKEAMDIDDGAPVDVIPEVAAEVVGYARSTLRDRGLHVLIDVGASTVDICSFILHEVDEGDQYALPTALVERLGVTVLHRRRLSVLQAAERHRIERRVDSNDPIAAIPAVAKEYAPERSGCHDRLQRVDRELMMACRKALMRTIVDLKRRREPKSSRWAEGLPVFLCGGGSRLSCYRDAVDQADERMEELSIGAGLRRCALPMPEDLDAQGLRADDFDRLAVAYGLSFDSLDIGKIVPPSDIDDIPERPMRAWEDDFVSKDQV